MFMSSPLGSVDVTLFGNGVFANVLIVKVISYWIRVGSHSKD